MARMLGWRPPEDRTHETRYALATQPLLAPSPVVMGCNWYESFDYPVKRGASWWIGLPDVSWGSVRGGHAVCLRPPSIGDLASAYLHYDQGSEGACAGFATARAATLNNRQLYDGFAQYEAAKRNDEWAGEKYVGTSINGALQGLRLEGAWPIRAGITQSVRPAAGILAFRWASSATDVAAALGSKEGFIRVLNSWGADYPREVRMPLSGLERLIAERAELGVPVDRPGR